MGARRRRKAPALCAFIPDIHFPFADHEALAACLDHLDTTQPEHIFVLGDLLDAYTVSSHGKRRVVSLQSEIDEAVAFLAELRARHPKARIYLHEGNHEERLGRYLHSQAKALTSLRGLSWPELLRLDALEIAWCEYRDAFTPFGPTFRVEHGDMARSAPGATPRGYLAKRKCSGVTGHTHRMGLVTERHNTRLHSWMECGHLTGAEVHREYAISPDWHKGFGMGLVSEHVAALWPVMIDNGKVIA